MIGHQVGTSHLEGILLYIQMVPNDLEKDTKLRSSCLRLEVFLLYMQIISGDLEIDTKLLSDCLMSLAVFEAWQEPLYLHLVAQARALPLAAYGPRSLRHIYQVQRPAGLSCTLLHGLEHAGCTTSA